MATKSNLTKIDIAISKAVGGGQGPCPQRKNATSFKPGPDARRFSNGGGFQKGHYFGFPSREAWAAAFRERKKQKRMTRKAFDKATQATLDIQEEARKIVAKNLKKLDEILNDEESSDAVKLQALQIALDRAYGKAAQTNVNINQNADAKPSQITARELVDRIDRAVKRVEGATSGVVEAGEGEERPSDLRKYN